LQNATPGVPMEGTQRHANPRNGIVHQPDERPIAPANYGVSIVIAGRLDKRVLQSHPPWPPISFALDAFDEHFKLRDDLFVAGNSFVILIDPLAVYPRSHFELALPHQVMAMPHVLDLLPIQSQ
jgi:hypothetical protein